MKEKERYTDTNSFWLYNQAGSGTHERTTEKDQGKKRGTSKIMKKATRESEGEQKGGAVIFVGKVFVDGPKSYKLVVTSSF